MWWWKWSWVICSWVAAEKVGAQDLPLEVSLTGGGLAFMEEGGGISSYPALLGKNVDGYVVMAGSRLYGTALGDIRFAANLSMEKQGFALDFQQRGGGGLRQYMGRLSYGLSLRDGLQLALRVGGGLETAQGYASRYRPAVGVGCGMRVTDRCQWLLQADGLIGFLASGNSKAYRVRTGLGYQVAEQVSLTAECVAASGVATLVVCTIHYQPTEKAWFRLGYSGVQLSVSGGFLFRDCRMELGLGWHPVLGLQQCLQISYLWNRRGA